MENDGVDLSATAPVDLSSPAAREVETLSRGRVPAPQVVAQAQPNLLPGEGQGMFGSVRTMRPAVAPENPLDAIIANATADRDRAQKRAADPFIQFMNKGFADKESNEAQRQNAIIEEAKQKKQAQQDMQAKAQQFGFRPGELPATATNDTLVNEAAKRFRETANVDMMKGLIAAGRGDLVQTYTPDAVAAVGSKADQAKAAIDQLDAAITPSPNQVAYNSALAKIKAQGIPTDSLPKTATEWAGAAGAKIRNDNKEQKQMVDSFNQKRATWGDYQNETNKDVAKLREENFKVGGETMPGFTAVNHPGNGSTGNAGPFGSNDIDKYGAKDDPKSWSIPKTKDNVENVQKQLEAAYPKAEREKNITISRAIEMATTGADGKKLNTEETMHKINTNPQVQLTVAEALAAAGRAGGGANLGIMKLGLAKQGPVQAGLDALLTAKAGLVNTLKGEQIAPYLTKMTQNQIRYTLDFIDKYNKQDISERLNGVAGKVGSYGWQLSDIGIEKELQPALEGPHAFSRDKAKLELSQKPRVIRDNDSVFLEGGKAALAVPGAVVTPLPLSALPGLTPGNKSDSGNTSGTASPDKTAPAATTSAPRPGSGGGNPPPFMQNPVAQTVYGTAGQVAMDATKSPVIAKNTATVVTSAARSESAFNANAIHDGGDGQGLFGHQKDRLMELQKFAGVPATGKPGAPIPADVQTAFMTKELSQAADKDKFIAATINNPNASAEDLTRVQIRLEKPQGYTGPGSEEKTPSWNQRLSNTKALMANNPTSEQIAAYNANKESFAAQRAKMAASATTNAANIAPALGAVAGTPLGPLGIAAGGAAGGAAKQYFNGGQGYPTEIAKGVIGAAPMLIPGAGPASMAARVVAGGASQGTNKAIEGGDSNEVVDATIGGAVGAVVGEGLAKVGTGIFNHVTWNAWNTATQKAALSAAKAVATEEPKIADATGKMVNNPKYTDAERFLKSHGKDPEEVAHNYRAAEESKGSINPSSTGEAMVARPGAMAEAAAKKEYNAIGQSIEQNKGTATNIQGKAALPDGPMSLKQSVNNPNGLPPKFNPMIDQAEVAITGKAKDFAEKYTQLKDARSIFLAAERDAIASMSPDKTETAKAMRAIGDTIRTQQVKVINATHPPDQAKVLVARLENADRDYALAMKVSGGNVIKTIAGGGKEGRDVERAFKSLAINDPDAMNAMRVLVAAEKGGVTSMRGLATKGWATPSMVGAMTLLMHSLPAAGGAIIGTKLAIAAYRYMAARGAGSNVSFASMFANQVRAEQIRRAGSTIGAGAGAQVAQ